MALFGWLQRLTPFDRKLLILVTIAICLSFLLPLSQNAGARVVVTAAGRVVFTAPLNQARTVALEGPLGMTEMEIAAGRVGILSSPCPNKTCIRMGKASHEGDVIACVPNGLIVRVEGDADRESEYDLISR